jgi:KDO2-lipid IV(A) lauroyltransferase
MARSHVLNVVEYVAARAGIALVDAIPPAWALSIARGVGNVAYACLGNRRRTAISNLLRTGVASDRPTAARIARESFRHFATVTVEALIASRRITPETLSQYAEIEVPAATAKLLDDPQQGILLVQAHLGNWEVVGHIVSFRKRLVAVARRMDNPLFRRLFERRNSRCNIEIVDKHSQDRHSLLRALRGGSSLGLVADQHAASHGVEVPFFGIPAMTVTSPARLHLATHCPIVCGYGVRIAPLRFKFVYSEPLSFALTGDKDADTLMISAELNRRLEQYIRLYPEQYLWSHRRWRTPAEPKRSPV